MNCPVCDRGLEQFEAGGVIVDVCRGGCGGIWFDNFELKKFDEKSESAGVELLNIERDPNLQIDKTKRLKCPKCGDVVMARHYFSIKREVEIDECPGCGSIWLDAGELEKIRSLFESEQEKIEQTEEFSNKIMEPHFASLEAESEKSLAAAGKFSNALKYICPSYYIPGKQKWGAF